MTKAFDCAMRLLARREHGARELADKLVQKGYNRQESNEAIAECQRLGFQSDLRFVEAVCHVRIRQGCGPLKISQELQAKHLDPELVNEILAREEDNWLTHALAVWHKKYKKQDQVSFAELQKQQRFLLYRGFPTDVITRVMKEI